MKTTAAVLVSPDVPLELAEITIPDLRPGQVLVEIAFSGICHTQLLERRGDRGPDPYLPHCLGHEGSGIVRAVGPHVSRCKTGDRVVLSWLKASGMDVSGTVYDWRGRNVNAGGVTTFAKHSVISENRITVIPAELPLDRAALIGCAVATGAGAVLNTVTVGSGQSLAVFGTGGVGLCSIMAAHHVGTSPILAVDINSRRLEIAQQLGATHLIDARSTQPVERIREVCPEGVDSAVEASGIPAVMRQALACVRARGGAAVVVGNARHGEHLELDPAELNQGKRLLGTWGGDCVPDRDFPRFMDLVVRGDLRIAALLEQRYALSEINQAMEDFESGAVVRPLVDMQQE